MTDDKLEAAIARGARAKELLGSELLKEVFAQIESDYIAGWRHTSARDTDARERLWLAVQVLGQSGRNNHTRPDDTGHNPRHDQLRSKFHTVTRHHAPVD